MKKLYFILFGVTLLLLTLSLAGCLEGDKKTDLLSGLSYKNNTYGFGFNPPEGWTTDTSIPGVIVSFIGPTINNSAINIVVTAGQLEPGETLYSACTQMIDSFPNIFTNYSFISRQNLTINNMSSHEIVIVHDQGITTIKQREVLIEKNGKALVLTFTAIPDEFDTYNLVFGESLNSVKIIW